MVRIIDKIHARRKEFKSERKNRVATSQQRRTDAEDGIPSHIRNRPHPQICSSGHPPTQGSTSNALDDKLAMIQTGWYYSFEFFPPKTEPGLDNLLTRIDRMSRRLDPLFVSVTWGANGSTLSRTLAVASHAQRFACVDVLLHLSCTGLTREQIAHILNMVKSSGVRNILALRGDPPQGKRAWLEGDVSGGECDRAIDLVKLIRKLHGDHFGIGVAGHPEGHPSSAKGEDGNIRELQHLKEKLDAGADFIITQFFYDVNVFLDYVQRCRKSRIDCPIIPGIMPIQSYSSLLKMTQFCGISVPSSVVERLQSVRHDDEAVKRIGCEIATEMCSTILTSSLVGEDSSVDLYVDGFHFYTLNLERSTTRILANLGAVGVLSEAGSTVSREKQRNQIEGDFAHDVDDGMASANNNQECNEAALERERKYSVSEQARSTRRALPWKPSAMANRSKETVRPINWSNRPVSYIMRTDDWDEVRKNLIACFFSLDISCSHLHSSLALLTTMVLEPEISPLSFPMAGGVTQLPLHSVNCQNYLISIHSLWALMTTAVPCWEVALLPNQMYMKSSLDM
jgi:methylenetetrahydrofolate reductase